MDKTKEIFYDKEKKFFLYLMIYISRFFMSDEEIVIFDLFVHNECLYLEKDIINCINMNEHKIRSILSKLLRDKFIIEVQKYKNNEKGSNYQTYYCLNNYIVYVIDFRIKQMENEIQKKKNESDIYICKFCNSTYSQLDAQTLPLNSYDAHFLCFCNNKIELIENDDNNDEKIYNKYTKYLNIIKEYIEKLKNYFIPLYTEKFNRNNLNSSNSFLSDNSSDGSVTNNSSEISLTNNSSLISQTQLNENIENGKRKKEEIYTDTCSSVIRKNKKIKICMNTKIKNPIKKNISDEKIKISNTINETKEENVQIKNNNITEHVDSNEKSNQNTKNTASEQQTKESEFPLFFIQKFNKKFTLIDAQKLQQDMSQEEFENFMELQDIYLDKL